MTLWPVTTAIKTLAENDLKWETVSERLTEKPKRLKDGKRTGIEISLAAVTQKGYGISSR